MKNSNLQSRVCNFMVFFIIDRQTGKKPIPAEIITCSKRCGGNLQKERRFECAWENHFPNRGSPAGE
jgi:hypothetical protein